MKKQAQSLLSNPWVQGILSFGFVLLLGQLVKLLDHENPKVIWSFRVMYLTSNLIYYGILYNVYQKIQSKNDETELTYVENPPMFSENSPVTIISTYTEYDTDELYKFIKTSFMSLAMVTFLHLRMGYIQPLFIQSLMPFKSLYSHPLIQIYIRKVPDNLDLRRPFKTSTPFSGNQVVEKKNKKNVKSKTTSNTKKLI